LSKANRFRERAEQCTKLAELATSGRLRQQYKKIAESYLVVWHEQNLSMLETPQAFANLLA